MTAVIDRTRTTVISRPQLPPPASTRRNTNAIKAADVITTIGSLLAAVASSYVLFHWLTPLSGTLGFVVVTYVLFLAIFTIVVSLDNSGPIVRDRLASAVVHGLALVVLVALAHAITFTILRGRHALGHANFFTDDLVKAGPLQPLSVGGVRHALVGAIEQILIALAVTVPLGITCAVFLTEIPGPFSRAVRTLVNAMTALPSIVAGLFIYASLILALGFEKSGLAASLAVSVEMLPIIIRTSDVVLRLVPGSLKEASYALGSGQWRTVWHVTLPTARSGLTTAVILGSARGIGETSPVLLTAGYTAATNYNPRHGPQVNMPLAAFELIRSGTPNNVERGFGLTALLMVVVLVLFAFARVVGGKGPGQLSPRQARRRLLASAKDAQRFEQRATRRNPITVLTSALAGSWPDPSPTEAPTDSPAPFRPRRRSRRS